MSDTPVLPTPDRDSAPFWDAVRSGRLALQQCSDCHAWRWPPRVSCNRCGGEASSWRDTGGRGRIVSWVVTHQPFSPGHADATPYVTAAVALEEQDDVVLLGTLIRGEPAPDLAVRAVFEEIAAGEVLVNWEPA